MTRIPQDVLLYLSTRGEEGQKITTWLEKRLPTPQPPLGEVEHIVDYLLSEDAPKNLSRATWVQMEENAQKWVKKLKKQGKDIDDVEGEDIETILDFGDGYKIVKLLSERAYKREGNLMSHCVASYADKGVEIYSLRDKKNMPHCTIEKDKQIKGKGNGDVVPKYVRYIVEYLEYTGMKVRDSEMRNLGYVPYPKEVVKNKLFRERYIHQNEQVLPADGWEIVDEWDAFAPQKNKKKYHHTGSLDLRSLTSAEGLTLPQSIGGSLDLRSLTSAKGLVLPQSIGGYLNLESLTSAEGLTLPQNVGGDLYLNSLTSAEGLTLPQNVGGDLYLNSLSSAEGLTLPQNVGGNLYLNSLTSAEGLTLPQSIGGYLDLESLSSAEGLTLPQNVGGSLYLNSLTSAEGLVLPQSIGGSLDLESLTSAEGLVLPQSIGRSLDLRSLTSAKGLVLPQSIGGYLDLESLTSAEGLVLPQNVGGYLNLESLTSAEGLALPQNVGGDLNLSSLSSAEGLVLPKKFKYIYIRNKIITNE